MRRKGFPLSLLLLPGCAAGERADLMLTNGTVWSGRDASQIAEAVAIRDGAEARSVCAGLTF